MSRQFLLDLAARRHRAPLAVDLALHDEADPESILVDGARLGALCAGSARALGSPLAFPAMDLRIEKLGLLRRFGVPDGEVESFHFTEPPSDEQVDTFDYHLRSVAPTVRVAANLAALHAVAGQADLYPIGMCIGPFSLTTKLMVDPITPVYLAGEGTTAREDPEVALLETCLGLSIAYISRYVELLIEAGARAIFVAEPAANQVYFSPRQMDEGGDAFERFALAPIRRIAMLLADHGVELMLHCCGELSPAMLAGLGSLRPALLSLGGSRRLWEDAAHVPADTVLYGNLPSKLFYSDELMPVTRVAELTDELAANMALTGHPFILGTECDTLHVPGAGDTIRAKIRQMLAMR